MSRFNKTINKIPSSDNSRVGSIPEANGDKTSIEETVTDLNSEAEDSNKNAAMLDDVPRRKRLLRRSGRKGDK